MHLPQPLPARCLEVLEVTWQTSRSLWCRWGEGLHQAVEAKEGLPVQDETVTLASISYQVSLGLTHQLMPAHIAASPSAE